MAFRDLILHNYRRKLFSLLLAVLVWLTIFFAERRERESLPLYMPTNTVIYP